MCAGLASRRDVDRIVGWTGGAIAVVLNHRILALPGRILMVARRRKKLCRRENSRIPLANSSTLAECS